MTRRKGLNNDVDTPVRSIEESDPDYDGNSDDDYKDSPLKGKSKRVRDEPITKAAAKLSKESEGQKKIKKLKTLSTPKSTPNGTDEPVKGIKDNASHSSVTAHAHAHTPVPTLALTNEAVQQHQSAIIGTQASPSFSSPWSEQSSRVWPSTGIWTELPKKGTRKAEHH